MGQNRPMPNDAAAIRKVFETVSLGAPERAVGFVLWRVVHRYMREVDRALACLELTHLQFMTLALAAWLGKSGEPVTQTDVARHGDMHPMQVSLMLKALEKKGAIVRPRSVEDVRAKHLELTVNGIRLLKKALPLVISVQQSLFGEHARVDGDFLHTLLKFEDESLGTPVAPK
jgi:DNA-binding MarR family transcriptional regulator